MFFTQIFISCNVVEKSKPSKNTKIVSLQKKGKMAKVQAAPNDFSDFKKQEEKCDTEEELLKKQFEKKEKSKSQAIKLQGANDSGCSVK